MAVIQTFEGRNFYLGAFQNTAEPNLATTEGPDIASFRAFSLGIVRPDTDYIHVDREKYLLLVPPSDNVIYVEDENKYTAPVRTRLLRKELI